MIEYINTALLLVIGIILLNMCSAFSKAEKDKARRFNRIERRCRLKPWERLIEEETTT